MIFDGDETIMQKFGANCNNILIENEGDWKQLFDYKGVCNVRQINGHLFVGKLKKEINKRNTLLKCKSSFVQISQPICFVDCRKIKEGDALAFLEKIAKLPKKPAPIIVIQNITEISADIRNIDKVYKLLIHIWEKKSCRLKSKNGSYFTITPKYYTVYRTWEHEEWDSLSKIWGTL